MEFEFKIIAVEKGTHSLTSEKGDKWDVGTLPDVQTVSENAPKKRVIELPADLLETLTVEKENASGLLGFFDMDGHSAEIMNWLGEFLPEPDNLEPENISADWYLDHVEFVPKKKTWVVERKVNGDYKYVGVYQDGTITFMAGHAPESLYSEITNDGMIKTEFTEELADEIIAGLGGEDGLLKLRKVKVEE